MLTFWITSLLSLLFFVLAIGCIGPSNLVDFFHEQAKRPLVFWSTQTAMCCLFFFLMGVVGPEVSTNADGSRNAGPIDLWLHVYDAAEVQAFLASLTQHQMFWLRVGWVLDSFAFLFYVPGMAFLLARGMCGLRPSGHWLRLLVLLPFLVAVPDIAPENLSIGFAIFFAEKVLSNSAGQALINLTGHVTPVKEVVGNAALSFSFLSALAVNLIPWLKRKRVT